MDEREIPTLDRVESVALAISVESIVDERRGDDREEYARRAMREYLDRIRSNVDSETAARIDESDESDESDYDSEWRAYHGSFFGTVDVPTWLKIANDYCLDLDWIDERDDSGEWVGRYRTDDLSLIPAVPDDVVPTMGILGHPDAGLGVIPAVAIEGTHEGWGDYSGEPILLVSFYVALSMTPDAGHPE